MQTHNDPNTSRSVARSPWLWLAVATGVVLVLILLLPRTRHGESASTGDSDSKSSGARHAANSQPVSAAARARTFYGSASRATTPEEIVAGKISQFGRSRREIVRRIARRLNKEVPADVEKFFDALESGSWDEIDAAWKVLAEQSGQYDRNNDHSKFNPDISPYWSAVLDAYGPAEQAHLWPAQKLLDYGNAVLNSLRPGMVYVGGTDVGRFIPALLNDTSDGEHHIVITQNALADSRYLAYVEELYGNRLDALTSDDSQQAFADYIADAQKRLTHDQQFSNEPKQIRPGEEIQVNDGRVQVSGMTAVMGVNEKLLQALMAKNPDLHFAVQESMSMPGTYANALPLGPLMELGAGNDQNTFTAERATQSLEYWSSASQQLLADPAAAGSQDALKAYSHDAASAANLLAAHNFTTEAEQAYRIATQVWPENPEATGALADLLVRTGRETEAKQLLEDFSSKYPTQIPDLKRASSSVWLVGSLSSTKP